MLNTKERLLLQRLSIFMGGYTLEAVEEVCTDEMIDSYDVLDLLFSLESKSLITVNEVNNVIRYSLLETIKQYSSEKLIEKLSTQKKHFEYYLKLSDSEKMRTNGIEQKEWVRILEAELDNLRLSIQWAFENEPENAFRFINLIGNFWLIKAYFREGLQTCRKALDITTVTDKKLRAEILMTAAEMCFGLGHFSELENFAEESISLFREINDKKGIASCLIKLGDVAYTNLELKKSKDYYDEAMKIINEINSKELKAKVLRTLSFHAIRNGDKNSSLNLQEESLKIFREIKDTHNIASVLASLGIFEFRRKNFERANTFSEESLSIARENGDEYFISINLINLGCIASEKKDFLKAEYYLEDSLKIIRKYGYTLNLHPALIYLAGIFKDKGDFVKAKHTYEEFLAGSSKSGGNFFLKNALLGLTECYFKMENFEQAVRVLSFAQKTIDSSETNLSDTEINFMENYKKILSDKLGDETFGLYWIEGEALSFEEVDSYKQKAEVKGSMISIMRP